MIRLIFNGVRVSTIMILMLIVYSCSNDGVNAPVNSGQFTTTLKPIDKDTTGVYELWASVETASGLDHDESSFRSLGRFKVQQGGSITDTSGNSFSPNLSRIANINSVGDVIVTIQPPGYFDTIPSNIKIIGGAKVLQNGSLNFSMSMSYAEILPSAGIFSAAESKYLLASPTSGVASQEYQKGVWFSLDTNGSSAGITLPVLSDTAEWIYQAWVIDRNNTAYIYNIGRFSDPNLNDGYNQCQGASSPWNLPGHDWLQANCPGVIPDIVNLGSGSYELRITLEPRFEQGIALSVPFYLTLFSGNISNTAFGQVQQLMNRSSANLPSGLLVLSAN